MGIKETPAETPAAEAPAETPAMTTLMDDTTTTSHTPADMSSTGKWYEGVEQDILTDPTLTPFIKEDGQISKDLLKSYVHAQRAMGKKRLAVPDKNTTPEEYRQLLNEIGLPPELENYEVKRGENSQLTDEDIANYKKMAFEIGILPEQASQLLQWQEGQYNEQAKIRQTDADNQGDTVKAELAAEWGDKLQENMEKAKLALHTFAGENADNIIKSELGNNPEFIKLMHKVAGSLDEDKFDKESVPSHYLDKTAAQRKLNEIQGDMSGPYYNKFHPAHESTVTEANELFQIIG